MYVLDQQKKDRVGVHIRICHHVRRKYELL